MADYENSSSSAGEAADNSTGNAENRADARTSSEVNIETEHIRISSGATVAFGSGNITNIRFESVDEVKIRSILNAYREAELGRKRPSPPPADAPLQTQVDHWF